jgi:outer membrane protein OmpA-like peptidoglycan-associated protein
VTILLYFRMGETTLTPESQALLATVITEAAARPVPRIAIAGHTDTMGESDLNNTLARARAEAVAVKLQQAGLKPEEIIEVTSHGENNPLIPTGPNVAEPRNRRVEVIIQ